MNLVDVYTQDTDNTFTIIAMNNQTVLKIPTPPPQQSVALAPLAGQRRKRPKLTTDQDDANHGDSTKQAIVAVLVENTDGDPGDLVVEGDRVSSPFMGGVKLAVSSVSVDLESCVHACRLSAHNSDREFRIRQMKTNERSNLGLTAIF